MSAFNQRIQPLRDLMKAKGLDAFVVRRNPNLAWAIAGRAHVPTTIDAACFDLIITQNSATAVTNVVEAPRLIAEELPSEVTVKTVKWSEGRDPQLPTGSKVGCDQPGGDLPLPVQALGRLRDRNGDQGRHRSLARSA